MRYVIPIGVFVALIAILAIGLTLDPRYVPSPLIDKPLPAFELPALKQQNISITANDIKGKPRLLNIWASWCVACRVEHPLLVDLANSGTATIVGVNYKDERDEAVAWLQRHGDPYERSIFDQAGRLGLDLGVYGVPETFVIDATGVIRYKQVGPITEEALEAVIRPLLERLNEET